jgi:hypothetical protein
MFSIIEDEIGEWHGEDFWEISSKSSSARAIVATMSPSGVEHLNTPVRNRLSAKAGRCRARQCD